MQISEVFILKVLTGRQLQPKTGKTTGKTRNCPRSVETKASYRRNIPWNSNDEG
jgi:hypothetical protein